MSAANKALVQRYFDEILNERNLGVCDEILAKAYVEHEVPPFGRGAPGKVDGPATLRQNAQALFDQIPDLKVVVEDVVAEGDRVAARVVAEGTTRAVEGHPLGGKHFVSGQMHWFRVSSNKLAEHWVLRDDLAAMLQLYGVRPPAADATPAAPRARAAKAAKSSKAR